jgi:hypothetical protein
MKIIQNTSIQYFLIVPNGGKKNAVKHLSDRNCDLLLSATEDDAEHNNCDDHKNSEAVCGNIFAVFFEKFTHSVYSPFKD